MKMYKKDIGQEERKYCTWCRKESVEEEMAGDEGRKSVAMVIK